MSATGGEEAASVPQWSVPLADVRLPAAAVTAATDVLEGGWLSMGPRVEEFERAVAERTGSPHAFACSSGTAALQLALAATGVGPGDEVVMPSLSFVAGANVTRELGAEPVFCDVISEDDLTLSPASVERCFGPRTKAVIAMHYGGVPCSRELLELTGHHGVELIEDAAHAIGASVPDAGDDVECGAWGEAGCFSFFANKNLPLGEGGMLVTASNEIADAVRLLRSHGMTTVTWQRHSGHASSYDVLRPGHNMRLDEARAAIGTVLLGELDGWNADRGEHVAALRAGIDRIDGVSMPFTERRPGRSANHLAVCLLAADVDREGVRETMRLAGVQTSVHYPPTHSFSAYRGARADVPVTDAIRERVLTLPLFPHMTADQRDLVLEALAAAVAR